MQLEKLSKFVKRRREIFNFYKNILSKFEFIDYQSENYSDNIKIFSNRYQHLFSIIKIKENLLISLRQ